MNRLVNIALNKFDTVPTSLEKPGYFNTATNSITVSMASLYHHYYLDNYGKAPPDPDPAQFEYLQFLVDSKEFRFRSNGIGISTAARRNRSCELGQAFCRLFLHDHLGFSYFAHIEHVLDKGVSHMHGGVSVQRCCEGDVPDYLCSRTGRDVYLAEAKGRYSSINFNSREFKKWRTQFDRVVIKNASGSAVSTKGFIVATRFATEGNKSNIRTTVYAEDPLTPGDSPLDSRDQQIVAPRIVAIHYSNIAEKINQPLLASSLLNDYVIPNDILFPTFIWELVAGPLRGRRFVGGYYSKERMNVFQSDHGIVFSNSNPFDLNAPHATFFGLEEGIFKAVVNIARHQSPNIREFPSFDQLDPFYSGVSILRDGTMLAPIEFVRVVEQVSF